MGWWLADKARETGFITRFDPAYWTVNFPRPVMASVVTTAWDALRVDAVFYRAGDLAGLIWEAEDRHDHVLLAYETARDFRNCRLSFRWRSSGVLALDAVNGPTLTIEGRDASGAPRSWYVRLWNYAAGTAEDALVSLDFADLDGGFLLPGEADPVWAGDVDRMFVSLVPPGFVEGSEALLAAPAQGWVELSGMRCEGAGSVLAIGDTIVPEHGLRIAGGYDDSYNLTPERLLRGAYRLGYRGDLVHYVGMSHYFRLEGVGGGLYISLTGGALNGPCAAWHADFLARAGALGFRPILSLSYELFDAHCWNDWKQRASDGSPGLTGWEPPSALLSPAHDGAMGYLQAVGRAFAYLARVAGVPVRFQVGEPWWWVTPPGSGSGAGARKLCLYDAAAVAALPAHDPIDDVRAPMDASQIAALDAAGALLAASTAALIAAVRLDGPAEALLLVYLPTVLDAAAPELRRANVPLGWAAPAFDVLQLEDYDWVTEGRAGQTGRGVAVASARLGYPEGEQHYFSGFVLLPESRAQWARIADAAAASGAKERFVWALPQVIRDGFVWFELGEDGVQAFDDVLFPLGVGREAEVAPGFSTVIVTSAGGAESRNADWAEARTSYDVGPGVRSEADIAELLAFFRARMGAARGFRLRDPFDAEGMGQLIGLGDRIVTRFPLVKYYGDSARRITRPVAGSVRVRVDGVEIAGWSLLAGGVVELDEAAGDGVEVRADFAFDVPVRFAEDRLAVNRATFLAGAAVSVPLVEVREA
jgi:uncharacterized protein (TIGR02217 family)